MTSFLFDDGTAPKGCTVESRPYHCDDLTYWGTELIQDKDNWRVKARIYRFFNIAIPYRRINIMIEEEKELAELYIKFTI